MTNDINMDEFNKDENFTDSVEEASTSDETLTPKDIAEKALAENGLAQNGLKIAETEEAIYDEFSSDIDTDVSKEIKFDEEERSYGEPVTVRPVEFAQFDTYTPTNTDTNKNLELLMDIKLELTVELGRCQLPVKKVLELTRGSIIELDKIAGESVELYANGKHIANGEVVVIEDNFGLRITTISEPEERIKGLK